jgi:hypothetical protein
MPHRTPPAAPTLGAPTLSRREAGAALVEALDVLSAALPRAVQMARTEERDAERAAVVAFVRGARLDELADAIERGEHRREEEK